jgi:hypothetical protein
MGVRVLLISQVYPREWHSFSKAPSLHSILGDPRSTLSAVREGWALRQLSTTVHNQSTWNKAYTGSVLRVPPLVLAALEACLSRYYTNRVQDMLLQLVLLVVDYGIAHTLEQLAWTVLFPRQVGTSQKSSSSTENDSNGNDKVNVTQDLDSFALNQREERLQECMPEAIRPKWAHIFPTYTTPTSCHDSMAPSKSTSSMDDSVTSVTAPLLSMNQLPSLIAHLYFSSPVTMLSSSCVGCWHNVRLLCLLYALYQAAHVPTSNTSQLTSPFVIGMALSIAMYLDLHSSAMIVPVVLLFRQRPFLYFGYTSTWKLIGWIVGLSLWLQGLSLLLVGSHDYLRVFATTHGSAFDFVGIPPNLSVLWYLHMELFVRFRRYFSILLGGLPYALVIPIAIRLYQYPMVMVRAVFQYFSYIYTSMC